MVKTMNVDCLSDKFKFIFTDDMVNRIATIPSSEGTVERIILDVHGLSYREAERFISNVINISQGCCVVEVIHGYRHGTKIKDMLRDRFLNPHIESIFADRYNLGITYLQPAMNS